MEFTPKLDWIDDFTEGKNPPPGAEPIKAADLLRYENLGKDTAEALKAQDTANATFNAKVRVDTTVGKRVFVTDAAGVEYMVSGDTGVRVLPASTIQWGSVVADSDIKIVRANNVCTLIISRFSKGLWSDPSHTLIVPPVGFGPRVNMFTLPIALRSGAVSGFDFTASGISPVAEPSTGNYYFNLTYMTGDPWPGTLPGTPG